MTKALFIAVQILRQNRRLFLLLMLWPYIMAAILCFGGAPDPDDVEWMLHQESFAGLALVAVTGSTLLGNEQRSRRIVSVLARAVGRPQYLLALLLASWLPLVLYVLGFLLAGIYMAGLLHRSAEGVFLMAAAQLLLGIWAGSVSIFWSVLLSPVAASIVSAGCIAAAAYAGELGMIGPARLLANLLKIPLSGTNLSLNPLLDAALTILAGAVWFATAAWLFSRRDLNLTAD